jgi:NTP pyrophosphatase (non-canonical NTP hydrolase)
MKLTNEFEPIRDWAESKGLYVKGDQKTQALKLLEEAGELAKSILKKDHEELKDAIGDCVVVLVNLSVLSALNFEDCVNSAYNVIKNRTGEMKNGTFVKDGV